MFIRFLPCIFLLPLLVAQDVDNSEIEISSCYSSIVAEEDFKGKVTVDQNKVRQVSLRLNKTTADCDFIYVRLYIGLNEFEKQVAEFVTNNSNTAITSPWKIIKLFKNDRSPTLIYLKGVFLGYSEVEIQALPVEIDQTRVDFQPEILDESVWKTYRSIDVIALREKRPVDLIFQAIIFALIIFGNTGIGLDVNWKSIRDLVTREVSKDPDDLRRKCMFFSRKRVFSPHPGLIIGFCCQYIIMPLTAFTVVNMIDLPPSVALGVFLMGCAPGGGGSNYHTYFLGGNLALSVTMTFFSTVFAIGMMPLWVFTLGRLVIDESHSNIKIDFKGIFISLGSSVGPFIVGIIINWKRPKLAKKLFNKVVRPMLAIIFVYLLTAGMVTNAYIFQLMKPKVLLAGICLPYVGFTTGFVIAMLAKVGKSAAVTVAVETGIQSTGVAITTLLLSLEQPNADIAVVGPLAVTMFTPIPLWITEIMRGIYLCVRRGKCCCKGVEEPPTEDEQNKATAAAIIKHELPQRESQYPLLAPSSPSGTDIEMLPVHRDSEVTLVPQTPNQTQDTQPTIQEHDDQHSSYDNMEETPTTDSFIPDEHTSFHNIESPVEPQHFATSNGSLYWDARSQASSKLA